MKTILNYKKPAFWVILAVLIICIIVAICFLTKPQKKNAKNNNNEVATTATPTPAVDEETSQNASSEDTNAPEDFFLETGADNAGESEKAPKHESTVIEIETTMIPTTTNLEGMHAGYAFIPIGGNVYRYTLYSSDTSKVTREQFLYECVETELDLSVEQEWKFYTLKEYPGCEVILGIGTSVSLFSYSPAIGVSDEEISKVADTGIVMMQNGSVISGKDRWLEFVEKTERGESAEVYLAYSYTNTEMNMSEELFEATKEDYPSIFINRLTYDQNTYTLDPIHYVDGEFVVQEAVGYDSPSISYKYLMHYAEEAKYSFSLFTAFDKYVLTDSDTVTWDELEWGMLSSNWDDYIDFAEVYCEYTWK